MKKSPLSTPRKDNNFRGGRGTGYNYNRRPNSNNNYYQFGGSNYAVPLDSSSPINMQTKSNWRYQNNKNSPYFHKNRVSNHYGNCRNNVTPDKNTIYFSQKNHGNQQQIQQNKDSYWYRNVPIMEIVDIQSIFADPWAELRDENKSVSDTSTSIDDSAEIKINSDDSVTESFSNDNTLNISNSNCEETKGDDSLDLQLNSVYVVDSSDEKHFNKKTHLFKDEISDTKN